MDNDDEPMGIGDAMMMRGSLLRQLRLLEEADEAERNDPKNNDENGSSQTDQEILTQGNTKILSYESYLSHQRYYDDFKHVDMNMIDYGDVKGKTGGGRVIIEQRKELGKGGLCWDAAFILAEHLITNEDDWCGHKHNQQLSMVQMSEGEEKSFYGDIPVPTKIQMNHISHPRIIELGGGTGLSGVMIAKAVPCHVTITDLPEILGLIHDNLKNNFRSRDIVPYFYDPEERKGNAYNLTKQSIREIEKCEMINETNSSDLNDENLKNARGKVWTKILRWGCQEDLDDGIFYDVIIGADIIASIYNAHALAQTLYALSGPETIIYISYKDRFDEPLNMFEIKIHKLFRHFQRRRPTSRNKNPGVWIMEIKGKL